MRRATHLYCHKCKSNLQNYREDNCDRCHADLTLDGSTVSLNTIFEEENMNVLFKIKKLFLKCCCLDY